MNSIWEQTAMAPRAVVRAAKKVSRILSDQQIPHALAGALAVGLYGFNRMTTNVVFVVARGYQQVLAQQFGLTTPLSGYLKGVSVNVGRVDVHFAFVGNPLRRADILSPLQVAGLPIIGVDALLAMKTVAGRLKDAVDVVELLKLGSVSIETVSKRLSGEHLKQFQRLVTIANLEQKGQPKRARHIMLAVLEQIHLARR